MTGTILVLALVFLVVLVAVRIIAGPERMARLMAKLPTKKPRAKR